MINIVIRTFLVYGILIFVLRIMGKREVAEVGVFDLIVLLMIADVAVLSIEKIEDSFLLYLLPIIMLTVLQLVISYLSLKINIIRKIFDGSPSVIIHDGKLVIKNMKKETLTVDELLTAARIEGFSSLNNIESAILETSGDISFFEKENTIKYKPYPIIISGEIVDKNLEYAGVTKEFVLNECSDELKDIFYADYLKGSIVTMKYS